jgi:hypothetical protein
MPGTARARKNRSRTKPAKPENSEPLLDFAKKLHVPMNEAQDLAHAFVLLGLGMSELGSDHGCAVTTIGRAMVERLEAIDESFTDLIQSF